MTEIPHWLSEIAVQLMNSNASGKLMNSNASGKFCVRGWQQCARVRTAMHIASDCTVRIASGRACEFLYNIAMIYVQERSKPSAKVFEVDS